MHVVWHRMPLYYFYSFPLAQIFDDLLDIFSQFFVDDFSPILWCKNDVIRATFTLVNLLKGSSLLLTRGNL